MRVNALIMNACEYFMAFVSANGYLQQQPKKMLPLINIFLALERHIPIAGSTIESFWHFYQENSAWCIEMMPNVKMPNAVVIKSKNHLCVWVFFLLLLFGKIIKTQMHCTALHKYRL